MVVAPIRPTSRLARGAYQTAVTAYLAGLVIWLVLGLVPSLAELVGPWHRGLVSVANGDGPLSSYARRITDSGVSLGPVIWVGLAYFFSILNLALGVLLMIKRPNDLVPRLLALAFIGTAATFNEPSHDVFHVLGEPPAIKAIHFAFHVVSGSAYLLAVVLFPAGRLPMGWGWSPRVRMLLAGTLTAAVVVICWRSSFISHPPFFVVFFGVLIPIVGIAAQSLQLRIQPDVRSHEQSRLLRAALLPALTVALVWLGGRALADVGWGRDVGLRAATAVEQVFPAVFAVVPVVLFVAIARHQLWGIDLVASRVLLVASMLTFVSVVYVGVVALTGVLLRGGGMAALLPLAVVACLAEPVRERCQTICNRLVFGQRMTPRDAIRSLVDRFSGVGDVDELTQLTHVVVESTRAGKAEIWLAAPEELVLLARHPPDAEAAARLALPELRFEACREALSPAKSWPVTHEGSLLAVISVSAPRGISLTTKETRLLTDLSHHAGLLVRNAQLTVDLERELGVTSTRTAELKASRQAVVLAQDRRRRQLERDIHDGAQQHLVALLIMLRGRLRSSIAASEPAAAVEDLRSVLVETRTTLSRLATGGAPRVLVESGLEAALDDAAAAVRRVGTQVDVSVVGRWRANVETDTAIYFCCLEALQNAVKHAAPTHIQIRLESERARLLFAVSDDGSGFDLGGAATGSGLGNLSARLLPLGGRVVVDSAVGSGTTVHGELPLLPSDHLPDAPEALTGAATP